MSHELKILCSDCWFKSFSTGKKNIKNRIIRMDTKIVVWSGWELILWILFEHSFGFCILVLFIFHGIGSLFVGCWVFGRHWHQILSFFVHFKLDCCDGIQSNVECSHTKMSIIFPICYLLIGERELTRFQWMNFIFFFNSFSHSHFSHSISNVVCIGVIAWKQ